MTPTLQALTPIAVITLLAIGGSYAQRLYDRCVGQTVIREQTENEPRIDMSNNNETTYKIVRFHFKGDNETIVRGLTLAQAQAHCNREDTHGEGWFDGYEAE